VLAGLDEDDLAAGEQVVQKALGHGQPVLPSYGDVKP
jgi:hypothetical protein